MGSENYNFNKLQAVYGQKHTMTNVHGLRGLLKIKSASISICQLMRMAIMGLQKGSGNRSRVGEKSGNLDMDIECQPCFKMCLKF